MKKIMMRLTVVTIFLILNYKSYGQRNISLSTPFIWSKVQVTNNWNPPTAIDRENEFKGTAFGYGANTSYSFPSGIYFKNRPINFNFGLGYYKQIFFINRPFNYDSQLYKIYYTDQYAYHSFQGMIGVTYTYPITQKYFFSGNLSYNWLHSFKQQYTPASNAGFEDAIQLKQSQLDYGRMLFLSAGINRNIGNKISIGFNITSPLYTKWRNDVIFKDDPKDFHGPRISLGSELVLTYHFKSNYPH